jgi:hypothetical protein
MKGLLYSVGIVALCFFVYGCYWVAKTGSYWLFYEDMVVETISETVKPECLIK